MRGLIIDCSVIFAVIFADERTPYALGVIDLLQKHKTYIPDLFLSEVINVLWVQEKRGRWKKPEIEKFLDLLEKFPFHVEGVLTMKTAQKIFSLARQYQLSCYDATYLELSLRLGLPLATQDKALRAAALQEKVFLEGSS